MKLELTTTFPKKKKKKKKKIALLGWSLKVSIISGRFVVVEMVRGFRSKVLIILIKCPIKI